MRSALTFGPGNPRTHRPASAGVQTRAAAAKQPLQQSQVDQDEELLNQPGTERLEDQLPPPQPQPQQQQPQQQEERRRWHRRQQPGHCGVLSVLNLSALPPPPPPPSWLHEPVAKSAVELTASSWSSSVVSLGGGCGPQEHPLSAFEYSQEISGQQWATRKQRRRQQQRPTARSAVHGSVPVASMLL